MNKLVRAIGVLLGVTLSFGWLSATPALANSATIGLQTLWLEVSVYQDLPGNRDRATFGAFSQGVGADFLPDAPLGVTFSQTGSQVVSEPLKSALASNTCQMKFKIQEIDTFWNRVKREASLGSVDIRFNIETKSSDRGSGTLDFAKIVTSEGVLTPIPIGFVGTSMSMSMRITTELWCQGAVVMNNTASPAVPTLFISNYVSVKAPIVTFNSAPLFENVSGSTYQGVFGESFWSGHSDGTGPKIAFKILSCEGSSVPVLGDIVVGRCQVLASGEVSGKSLTTPLYSFAKPSSTHCIFMLVTISNSWSKAFRSSTQLPFKASAPVVVKKPTLPNSTGATKYASTKYPNCATLNKRFSGGIRKFKTTVNKGSALRITPFTSLTGYTKNAHLDRDKDGIACEK